MKIKKIHLTLFTFVMTTLASCDPVVDYEQIIYNQTDHNISLIMLKTDSLGDKIPMDTLLISKQSEKVIYNEKGIGQVYDYAYCPGIYFTPNDYQTQINNDTLLGVDSILEMPSKWNFEVIKDSKIKGGSCQCKLIILNENIN